MDVAVGYFNLRGWSVFNGIVEQMAQSKTPSSCANHDRHGDGRTAGGGAWSPFSQWLTGKIGWTRIGRPLKRAGQHCSSSYVYS